MTRPYIAWTRCSPGRVNDERGSAEVMQAALDRADDLRSFLSTAARAGGRVLLLVNDPHRATRTHEALKAIARVANLSADRPRFQAIIATGTHRFAPDAQAEFEVATFAECGLDIERITWHDARDDAQLASIAGVRLHRILVESSFLLPIGSVEPHYFAGVTGPHKTLTVGCMAYDDIEANHAHALDAAADTFRLAGNPVFDGIANVVAGLRSAGKQISAIAQVLRGERIVEVAVGEPLACVDRLLPAVRNLYAKTVPQPVDVLHLKVTGPLAATLYQADKALKNSRRAVRDGGGIILEAACTEGIGPHRFIDALRQASDHDAMVDIIRDEGYRLGDHKAVRIRHLTDPACRGVHVAIVAPGLWPASCEVPGLPFFSGVSEALDWLGGVVTGPLRRGLVVEDAGMLCVSAEADSGIER